MDTFISDRAAAAYVLGSELQIEAAAYARVAAPEPGGPETRDDATAAFFDAASPSDPAACGDIPPAELEDAYYGHNSSLTEAAFIPA